MWNIFKRYGYQPTPISKPNRLRRREGNGTARAAIDIGNTTKETVNVNETSTVTLEETEPTENTTTTKINLIGSVEISITT